MSVELETVPRPMPAIISIPLMLLCLAGGGYIIRWYIATNSLVTETTVTEVSATTPTPSRPGNNRLNIPPNNSPRRITSNDRGGFTARTEMVSAQFRSAGRGGKVSLYYFTYQADIQVPAEAKKTREFAKNLSDDPKRVEALKITGDQLNQLRNLTRVVEVACDPATRDDLSTLFVGWESATDKAAAQEKLLAALDEAGKKYMAATRQEAVNRAAKIDQIITPDMWQQNVKLGGGNPHG